MALVPTAVSVKNYLCRFYYSISQNVITLSGRRFITVSGVFITLSGTYYIIGRFFITLSGTYYIIGRLLHYRLVQLSATVLHHQASFQMLLRAQAWRFVQRIRSLVRCCFTIQCLGLPLSQHLISDASERQT